MPRSPKRLATLLACAAVPVMLVAGCSDSDSGKKDTDASKSASPSGGASASPSVEPAKYKKLPNPCESISKDTIKKLLENVKDENGEQGKSSDTSARGYCAWNSSAAKGVEGTQYRWLDVSFQRYDSDPALGSGNKRAKEFYKKQINVVKGAEGGKEVKAENADGIGDEATWVTYDLKKDGNDFKNSSVIARTANAVVTLNFNGAGLAGGKAPDAGELLKNAQDAAKEAVASVGKANG